jgi:tRNA U34 5-carboxymethylaminomethyl modifying enzyme MnmG/GidA
MGLDTMEIYPNGLATSLPMDIQVQMLRSIQAWKEPRLSARDMRLNMTMPIRSN